IQEEINKYREKRFPAVIPIPGTAGSLGIGMSGVKKCVEKAVGADILFRDD
ncbi:MAG TPA: V-type ATP synthase subunit F, partial [Ruminiclostridium sp.]|nr:V-type ATP synthase subunit F [Ruminiclostridium sp.]